MRCLGSIVHFDHDRKAAEDVEEVVDCSLDVGVQIQHHGVCKEYLAESYLLLVELWKMT